MTTSRRFTLSFSVIYAFIFLALFYSLFVYRRVYRDDERLRLQFNRRLVMFLRGVLN